MHFLHYFFFIFRFCFLAGWVATQSPPWGLWSGRVCKRVRVLWPGVVSLCYIKEDTIFFKAAGSYYHLTNTDFMTSGNFRFWWQFQKIFAFGRPFPFTTQKKPSVNIKIWKVGKYSKLLNLLYLLSAFGSSLPGGEGGLPSYDYHWTLTGPSHPSGGLLGASRQRSAVTIHKFNKDQYL